MTFNNLINNNLDLSSVVVINFV